MKIKTSELTGTALDGAVAKCEGRHPLAPLWVDDDQYGNHTERPYSPATDWAQGGPIIEREKMEFRNKGHYASYNDGPTFYGETHLIAAMRCYVASKLGDEIEIPEELT